MKQNSEAWRRKLGYSVVGVLKVCQEADIDQRGNFSWFGQEEERGLRGSSGSNSLGKKLVKVQGQKG